MRTRPSRQPVRATRQPLRKTKNDYLARRVRGYIPLAPEALPRERLMALEEEFLASSRAGQRPPLARTFTQYPALAADLLAFVGAHLEDEADVDLRADQHDAPDVPASSEDILTHHGVLSPGMRAALTHLFPDAADTAADDAGERVPTHDSTSDTEKPTGTPHSQRQPPGARVAEAPALYATPTSAPDAPPNTGTREPNRERRQRSRPHCGQPPATEGKPPR